MKPRIGIVTCLELPEPDPDQQITFDAFVRAGAEVQMVPWDAGVPPDNIDLFVIRSPWNYYTAYEQFVEWIKACPALCNPLDTVLGNLHKEYLLNLNVPTVPTRFFRKGAASVELYSGERVIKPSVSAGSWKTRVFAEGDPCAQTYLEELVAERDVMVQPFMESVLNEGEKSLIWIDGEVTHAIRKSPRWDGEDESVTLVEPTQEELEFARRAMESAPEALYGRVDLMRDGDGQLVLSELELVEPSLFFLQNPEAAHRFAHAILNGVGVGR